GNASMGHAGVEGRAGTMTGGAALLPGLRAVELGVHRRPRRIVTRGAGGAFRREEEILGGIFELLAVIADRVGAGENRRTRGQQAGGEGQQLAAGHVGRAAVARVVGVASVAEVVRRAGGPVLAGTRVATEDVLLE